MDWHASAQPEQHTHVLLMRTMSKFGLAGVRIGYLMGRRALIAEIEKVQAALQHQRAELPNAALFALEHADEFTGARRRPSSSSGTRLLACLARACRA
jgi:histidinol-phosphate aminotransferase